DYLFVPVPLKNDLFCRYSQLFFSFQKAVQDKKIFTAFIILDFLNNPFESVKKLIFDDQTSLFDIHTH
ncbi:MAG: hypothetical protein Q7V19_09110, partial [Bacteroidales bacterium]|nr:hypothetical protein [Bacteroidales bacterium]